MRTHAIIGARWEPLPLPLLPAQERLEQVLASWDRTPYRSGGSRRGVEGDCIGAVFGVIDEMDGRSRRQAATMPSDAAFHNPAAAYRGVAALRRLYRPAERLRHWLYQPGDILVVGTTHGGPGHVMIVGGRKNTLWQAHPASGFAQSGWALGQGFERLFAAYRLGDRERWLR